MVRAPNIRCSSRHQQAVACLTSTLDFSEFHRVVLCRQFAAGHRQKFGTSNWIASLVSEA